MTLDELNRFDHTTFTEVLGGIFEDSPWVAERVWKARPFESAEQLWREMCGVVEAAAYAEQVALIRAHPDLGARTKISETSTMEQTGAGLDQLASDEYEVLVDMNRLYREKFGFPFIFAVRGSGKQDAVLALQMRLDSSPEEEFRQALFEIGRIARFRLKDMLEGQ
jgi:OHCU decarboxylase